MKDSARQAEIEILKYLIAHQEARDTVEGIEKWWLPQSRQYGMADIVAALRHLEERDLVRVWKSASAKPVYGRSPAVPRAMEDYLRSLE